MSIYSKERAKITVRTVVTSLGIIIGIWALLFVTDYIMYKSNMPLLFSKTHIEEKESGHMTIENGLGYYVIKDENSNSELYLFGWKIK